MRDYLVACVLAAPPSESRERALELLGADQTDREGALDALWDDVEREAERQGCTIADIISGRAGSSDADADLV